MKNMESMKVMESIKTAESMKNMERVGSMKSMKNMERVGSMKSMENRKPLLRMLSLCMALVLACSLPLSHTAWAAARKVAGESGREAAGGSAGKAVGESAGKAAGKADMAQNEIRIHTVEDFLAFADHCSLDSWSASKRVILEEDIDLSGVSFEAVPVFSGSFDGQKHTISGFEYCGDGYVAGLFRYIGKNSSVKNLKLKGEVIAADEKECIGGLCGVNYGTIQNCSFQGTVSGNTTVGGIAGVNEGTGLIQDSSVKGHMTGYHSTGGIVGRNHGTVNHCTNRASINNSSEWVEEADEMGAGLFAGINGNGEDPKLFSGVDSGGIAGCSDGTVIKCVNYGKIGYEHIGYNIGGIVGRQSGVVALCKNKGTVYGRKDVGGIVGQMEPYIEVDEAETLRNAVNKLHGLIEKTVEDMQDAKNSVKKDMDALTAYSDGAVDAGNALAGQMAGLVDDSLDQAQLVADRLGHAMDMMPDVFDDAVLAEESFSKANQALNRMGTRLGGLGGGLGAIEGGLDASAGRLEEVLSRVNVIIQEMQADSDISGNFEKLQKALADLSDAAATVISRLKTAAEAAGWQASGSLGAVEKDLDRLAGVVQRVDAIIKEMQKSSDISAGQLKKLQEAIKELSDAMDAVRDSLKTAAGNAGGQAADILKAAGDDLENVAKAQQGVSAAIQEILKNPKEGASHLEELKKALTGLSDAITAAMGSLRTAIDGAGQQAADSLKKTLESDLKKLEEAQQRLKTILHEIQNSPNIDTGRLGELQKALTDLSDAVAAAIGTLETAAGSAGGQIAGSLRLIGDAMDTLEAARQRLKDSIQEIQNSPNLSSGRIEKLQKALAELTDAATAAIGSLNTAADDAGKQTTDSLIGMGNDLTEATDCLQQALDSIKTAAGDVRSILDYVNGQENIRFSKLGRAFDVSREDLRTQLQGVSGCIRSLGNDASAYSDVVNEDLKAVNDQMNVIFNLLADKLADSEAAGMEDLYEDVDIEDTGSITAGKADNCINKGTVKGDINVGGIAGAMAIDEEDLEGSAAGSVEYQPGRKYFTKCLITNCTNDSFITAKKDGAGGIVGYMRHGVVADCEGYGSVESTEGDYAGGICGESLTVIRRCYALCSVSGGKNVGGIAGAADTLKDCYAVADCSGTSGRIGAIAGQTVNYDQALNEGEVKVSGNYYVGDKLYGINNISYAGAAEPISYEKLLKTEGLPSQFCHLKVIFKVDDLDLGTQEVPYGASLSELKYPDIPKKEGYYGVWPDHSGQVMEGNLLVIGEYKEDVTVVPSNAMLLLEGAEDGGGQGREIPYALAEQRFTEDTVLKVAISDGLPPEPAGGKEYMLYDVVLEQAKIGDADTFAIRLYNPYGQAVVYSCKNGLWARMESKARGRYLQVDMEGKEETFCVIREQPSGMWTVLGIAGGIAVLALLYLKAKKRRHR